MRACIPGCAPRFWLPARTINRAAGQLGGLQGPIGSCMPVWRIEEGDALPETEVGRRGRCTNRS